jgi:glycerol-1-phosphatase
VIPAEEYEAFLFDLDGVVYRGSEAVPGAARALARLREGGRRVIFLTNNSARTPGQIVGKLEGLGVAAAPREVVTSAQALAGLLAGRDGDRTAYVIGEDGVTEALREAGIEVLEGQPEQAGYVVVGWDRHLTYDHLRTASVLVGRGATLVATNADASYPAEGGELWPGAGSILAAVETATGVSAEVAGKPDKPLFEAALERAGTRRAAVIGDRIETDIAGARAAGLDGILVWTGAASPADLLDNDALPVATIAGLEELLEQRPLVRIRPAGAADTGSIETLLEVAGLDAADASAERVVAVDRDQVIGTAACEVQGDQAYLRSVTVSESSRGFGVGVLVTAAAVSEAAGRGARRAFLVTESAEGFFSRLGFEPVERAALPRWVLSRSTECSETAAAMTRSVA